MSRAVYFFLSFSFCILFTSSLLAQNHPPVGEGEIKDPISGKILTEAVPENGKRKFFNHDGTLEMEENYKDGKRVPPNLYYDKQGKLIEGKEERTRTLPDGKSYINTLNNFKNGLREGAFVEYFPNGKVKEEANFKAGLYNGIRKVYNAGGMLLLEVAYLNGKAVRGFIYTKDGKKIPLTDAQKKDMSEKFLRD